MNQTPEKSGFAEVGECVFVGPAECVACAEIPAGKRKKDAA
jgi:predicted RecA/RadA family phage recombinase